MGGGALTLNLSYPQFPVFLTDRAMQTISIVHLDHMILSLTLLLIDIYLTATRPLSAWFFGIELLRGFLLPSSH